MFRKRRVEKKLSAEELKTKLYSHLDKTGSLNRMRVELREKLVSELLKKTSPVEPYDVNSPIYTFDKAALPLQISNWLVYDHLLRQGYQYALSIFVTEANFPTHPEKLLAACDILVLLGLDSNSSEYKSISQMCSINSAQGFSYSLLGAVIKCLFDLTTSEGKFNEIPETKKSLNENEHKVSLLKKISDSESSEFIRTDNLLGQRKGSAELTLHDQVQLLKVEKEKEVQALRHKLLEELDRLHGQEHKQQVETEQLRNEMVKERSDLLREKEKLRQKEILLDKEYENKLERKTRELESDFLSKIHIKERDLEGIQRKLNEKEQRLNQLEINFSTQEESCASLKRELEDIKNINISLNNKYSNLLDENTNLLKKFESMSDYSILKGDLEARSKELASLRQELEECQKHAEKEKEVLLVNLRKLETKLRTMEPELLEAQRQLNLTRDTLHMEEVVWHKERRKLEQESQSSREMYQTLIHRIEEQREDIQALHRTIHILHYQLTDKSARNTARVQPFIPNRTSFQIPDISSRGSDVYKTTRTSPPKHNENYLKFIEETKGIINNIQQEGDDLQNNCSLIYSSAKFTPALSFNSTTSQKFQPSTSHAVRTSFASDLPSNRFENRNELPTLDLSFPNYIRSPFSNTITSTYNSGAFTIAPVTTTARNSLDNPAKDLLAVSEDLTKTSVAPSSDNQYNIFSETFKVGNKDGVNVSKVANNSQILPSSSTSRTNVFDRVNKTPSANVPDNLRELNNSRNLPRPLETAGNENQQPATKNHGKNIENLPVDTSLEPLTETEINKAHQSDLSFAKSYETKTRDLKDLENANKILPEKSFESAHKEYDSIQKAQEKSVPSFDVPIIVDLDAAWKRKTSLIPSDTPNQNTKSSSEFLPQKSDDSYVSNFKTSDVEIPPTSSSQYLNIAEESPVNYPGENNTLDSIRENDSKRDQLKGTGQESPGQDLKIQASESLKIESKSEEVRLPVSENIDVGISKYIDPDGSKHALSDHKPILDESLSELSEMHLSCGSEQEQQKEDSDNW